MNSSQILRPGTTLYNGDYRIISVIGRGGFGITYLAENVSLGKRVAIKEFFPSGMYERDEISGYASLGSSDNRLMSDKLKAKFLKEARRIASLDHESIVRVTAAFEENGTAYYVMDLIDGSDLHTIIKESGPLPVPRAVYYITQVGKALEYLHSLRINHLDVKPANILINPKTDKVVLIDFGLSKQYDNGGHQTSTTPVGISEGYAPIEQYKTGGVQEFSAQTDVYSLAATLYYLLTGQRPPSANDLVEEELTFPSSIPANVRAAITRAMSTRRSDRYKTVGDFLAAITADVHNKTVGDSHAAVKDDDRTVIGYTPSFEAATEPPKPKDDKNVTPVGKPSGKMPLAFKVALLNVLLAITLVVSHEIVRFGDLYLMCALVVLAVIVVILSIRDKLAKDKARTEGYTPSVETATEPPKPTDDTAKPQVNKLSLRILSTAELLAAESKSRNKKIALLGGLVAIIMATIVGFIIFSDEAFHSTPNNLDLCVSLDGQYGYISEDGWKSLNASFKKEVTKEGLYISDDGLQFLLALEDLDGGREMDWDEAMRLYGARLPSKDQAEILANNRHAINQALETFGGTGMDELYWTKTEIDKDFAFRVYMNGADVVGINVKTSIHGRVRAVAPVPGESRQAGEY